jgi:V/A-type H+/Na+-transporting ATPase subunit D
MAEIKLTKNELRFQQIRLTQLQKYLPTLQLKKAMLQQQVNEVRLEILHLEEEFQESRLSASHPAGLLSERFGFALTEAARIKTIKKRYENIAGVDIPIFEEVFFAPFDYPLLTTPPWLDSAVFLLRKMTIARSKILIAQEKKAALEKELREVTIRVNLFGFSWRSAVGCGISG